MDERNCLQQILVVGVQRSGTTWLAKLLDSHPDTLYRHEPDQPPLFPGMPRIVFRDQADRYRPSLREFADALRVPGRVRACATLPVFRKRTESFFRYQCRRAATIAVIVAARGLGNVRIPNCIAPSIQVDGLRVLWKSVKSVGRVGMLVDVLRPLNVVLIVRHPCGVIDSRQRGVKSGVMKPVSRDQLSELLSSHAHHSSQAIDLRNPSDPIELEAYRWALLNSKAMADLDGEPGCVVVRYEDLCAEPTDVMRHVLSVVGLDWHHQVDKFIKLSMSTNSRSFYGLCRRKGNTDSWRKAMPSASQRRVLDVVQWSEPGQLYVG